MSELSVEVVPFESSAYHEAFRLRDEILRRPLGLALSAEDMAGEQNHWHLVARTPAEVVGCVVLQPLEERQVQLRQMAVSEAYRGAGLGRRLLEASLRLAETENVEVMTLNAREPAIGFYRKAGFEIYGEGFVWHGVPHRRMRRSLSTEPGS